MKMQRVYIPKLTHRDNNTRRWQKVIFILSRSKVQIGKIYMVDIGGGPVRVRAEEKLDKNWYKCKTEK